MGKYIKDESLEDYCLEEDEIDTSDCYDYGFNDEDNAIETFTDLVEAYEDSI